MERFAGRLPGRFPVGTKYVVEGRDAGDGRLRIRLRLLEFPDGRKIRLPLTGRGRAGTRRSSVRQGSRAAKK
jgi:hypothetical protein